jgi:hypothetical protein
MRRFNKPRNYEDEPEQDLEPQVGSFSSWTELHKDEKPRPPKHQIGFIRQKRKPLRKKRKEIS